jgi:hypothetical protein
MNESSVPSERGETRVRFTSHGCDNLEIREEDTRPGKVSESYRKWLEAKYGRKGSPPPNRDVTQR